MYECDGCGYTGTEEEVGRHVLDNATLPGGQLKDPQDIVCWGAMEVGGPAWVDYHINGIHPMQRVAQQIQNMLGL
jgi:hypothetical protein